MRLGPLLLVLAGCISNVVHETKLPDRSGSVAILEEIEGQYVFAFGEKFGPYDGVGVESLQPSPDGHHVAWAASQDGAWSVFIDGKKRGDPWVGIGELVWSPKSDRLLYTATIDERWQVVTRTVDASIPEDRGSSFSSVAAGSMRFSRSGSEYGFIGLESRVEAYVMTSRKRRGPFRAAGALSIDDDGGHVAFTALEDDGAHVYVDAEQHGPYLDVAELVLAPRLGRYAASVMTAGGGWRALVDGRTSQPMSKIGHFTFSADASRLAWAEAEDRDGKSVWQVHVDATTLGPYEAVDHAHLAFASDGSSYAFAAKQDAGYFIVQDGNPLEGTWKRAELLTYGSSVLGYIGVDEKGAAVIVGGQARGRYDAVSDLALDPAGKSWLAVADLAGKSLLVKDGTPLAFDVVAAGTLAFDERGAHWGGLVGDKSDRSMWFVVDGKPTARLEFEDLANLVQARKDTDPADKLTKQLRAWVAAELARASH